MARSEFKEELQRSINSLSKMLQRIEEEEIEEGNAPTTGVAQPRNAVPNAVALKAIESDKSK